MRFDVAIVGTGQAGTQAAIALRGQGFAGSIGLIGDESDPPYDRPSLSKEYLGGHKPFERIRLRPDGFWDGRRIALVSGTRIASIDSPGKSLETDRGARIGYGRLIWAAGGAPRRLRCPGGDLACVHTIRDRADVDRLKVDLAMAARIVVIGGGYIGLESAAVLTGLGKQVTLVEAQDRVLARVAGGALSRFFAAEHRRQGVDLRLDAAVDRLEGVDRVTGVRLADGTLLPCDLVIVGIGIAPAIAPLHGAGAARGDGVLVDRFCRTSLPDIWAIGDCAAHADYRDSGTPVRLESVQNANDMALCAANAIVGKAAPFDAMPWFWSQQYDLKLQTIGLSSGHDEHVVRGSIEARSFSVVYLRAGRIVALDCVNRTKDYVPGPDPRRRWCEGQAGPDCRCGYSACRAGSGQSCVIPPIKGLGQSRSSEPVSMTWATWRFSIVRNMRSPRSVRLTIIAAPIATLIPASEKCR